MAIRKHSTPPAEPDTMDAVKQVLSVPGIYIITGPGGENDGEVPVVSINGKIFAMRFDQELEPQLFHPECVFAGPFRGKFPSGTSTTPPTPT